MLSMSFHTFLACVISYEKFAVILTLFSLYLNISFIALSNFCLLLLITLTVTCFSLSLFCLTFLWGLLNLLKGSSLLVYFSTANIFLSLFYFIWCSYNFKIIPLALIYEEPYIFFCYSLLLIASIFVSNITNMVLHMQNFVAVAWFVFFYSFNYICMDSLIPWINSSLKRLNVFFQWLLDFYFYYMDWKFEALLNEAWN